MASNTHVHWPFNIGNSKKKNKEEYKDALIYEKRRRGTATDEAEESDFNTPRSTEFIGTPDPTEAKTGLRIQFIYDDKEGTVYWLEGTIEQ